MTWYLWLEKPDPTLLAAPLDEGPKEGSGSGFKNTVYFFRSGSGSLVTVTDQRVDSRKRQRQALRYYSYSNQLSISASLSFSLDSFLLLYLDSRSTRLDSASRRANRALSMLDSATFCCFRAGTNYSLLLNCLGISTSSNVFEICLRHAPRNSLRPSLKPTPTVKNT